MVRTVIATSQPIDRLRLRGPSWWFKLTHFTLQLGHAKNMHVVNYCDAADGLPVPWELSCF